MTKKKNIMEMVPVRNKRINWNKKDGIISLMINRNRLFDRIMHKMFRTPKTLTVDLEEIGSFIWEQCDGLRNVHEISRNLEDNFGEKVEPVVARMLQYLKILAGNNFIKLELREDR